MCLQNGLNALHLASKEGHLEVVTELLKRGAQVDASTKVNTLETSQRNVFNAQNVSVGVISSSVVKLR